MRRVITSVLTPRAEAERAEALVIRETVRTSTDPYLRAYRQQELRQNDRMAQHQGRRRP